MVRGLRYVTAALVTVVHIKFLLTVTQQLGLKHT